MAFPIRLDAHVSSHLFCPHWAQQQSSPDGEFVSPVQIVFEPLRVCRIILHQCGNPGSTLLRVRLSDHQANLAAQRRSELRHHLLRDVDASDILFVPGLRYRRSGLHFWVHHLNVSGRRCGVGIDFHASVLQAPRISKYFQQHFTDPAFFFVSSPNAAARQHCCVVAHDVSTRSRVETEPATVQSDHSEFLLWSRGLVWFEQDLCTERCILLIEWFASDTLVSCHTVTANVERRQCPWCMSRS